MLHINKEVVKVKIDADLCINCQNCVLYCPVNAIKVGDENVYIDQELCVDCGVCIRSGVCTVEAVYLPETPWPRSIRAAFSGGGFAYYHPEKRYDEEGRIYYYRLIEKTPLPRMSFKDLVHYTETGLTAGGRGTMEMKNNDRSGRFKDGEVGVACELGRPCIGFYWRDLEKVSMAVAEIGVDFEPQNPTSVLLDLETGRIKDDYSEIRDERTLSAIVECKTTFDKVVEIYEKLQEVAKEIDTVFSMSFINKCQDGSPPLKKVLDDAGISVRINGKTNIGVGRPLYDA